MKKNVILPFLFMGLSAMHSVNAQTLADRLNKFSNFSGAIDNPTYDGGIDANRNCPDGSGDKAAPKALKAFLINELGESPNDASDYGITTNCQNGFHPSGRALDWQPGSPSLNQQIGNQVVDWLTKNNGEIARRMGIVQIIWTPLFTAAQGNNRGGGGSSDGSYGFWSSYRNKWESYGGDNSHSYHVHFSFGGNGDLSPSFWQQYKPGGTTSVSPPAPVRIPIPTTLANGTYTIRLANGKAIDANAAEVRNNGGKVAIWDYANGATEQQWILTAVGRGRYTVQVKASGKALDVSASNANNGGAIALWDLHRGANQQWIFAAAGNGLYKIHTALSPYRVMDVFGGAISANGTKIQLWDLHGGTNQLWKIEAIPSVAPPPPVVVTPPVVTEVPDPTPGQQDGWRWCSKCQAIFFGGAASRCPTGGSHLVGTRSYLPFHGVGTIGQVDWRWCNKCSGLFYNGHATHGVCPAGGQHTGTSSWNYHLNFSGDAPGQGAFRWCNKCEILHYGGMQGVCPAGGAHGDINNSHDYKIPFRD